MGVRWEPDVGLAAHTRYGIGGPTPRLGRPATETELRAALRELAGRGFRVLGGGANVLVADRGVREPVLILGGRLDYLRVGETTIEAGAATRLPALVGKARRSAREGWAFLEAVPGTVGGGLRMNAGSREVWMWHRVRWAEAMAPDGETVRVAAGDARAGYREVGLPQSWTFTRACFDAPPGAAERVDETHLRFRQAKVRAQVYELPSVGSTWKNPGPPHGSAWQIVERVGMRGARRGDAEISERHANFIVNHGTARASEVLALMTETRRRALEELGVALQPEIVLWGFHEDELQGIGARREAGDDPVAPAPAPAPRGSS